VAQAAGHAGTRLVEELILNDWFLQRTQRRYIAVEQKLSDSDYLNWDDQQRKEYDLANRYKSEAGRAFDRALLDDPALLHHAHSLRDLAHSWRSSNMQSRLGSARLR